jgi:hypothetical protein
MFWVYPTLFLPTVRGRIPIGLFFLRLLERSFFQSYGNRDGPCGDKGRVIPSLSNCRSHHQDLSHFESVDYVTNVLAYSVA